MSSIKHTMENESELQRVVILGAAGFIGKNLTLALEKRGISVLGIGREEVDLTEKSSSDQLAALLQPTDAVVVLATITPDRGRGIDSVVKNVQMAENFSNALGQVKPAHVVYLSSDTVYSLHRGIITEESPADPENLFGVMHLTREYMIKASTSSPVACLRSTLVYGAGDTHNSYGPNRMRRSAQKGAKIKLFGKGEEYRDHIYIHDLAELITLTLLHRSEGILNLVTGKSISYFDLAHKVSGLFDSEIEIETTERQNPITHRHFDATSIYAAFPTFCFTTLEEGLASAHEEEIIQV